MAYDKNQLLVFANALVDAGGALKDGFQLTEDSDEILAVGTALVGAADEFKEDFLAALLHVSGRIADVAGDLKRQQAGTP